MTRVDIPTGIAFDEFRRAFEQAAPPFDANAIRELTDKGGTWDDIKQAMAARAPHELLTYAMIDASGASGLGPPVRICVSQRYGHETRIGMDLPSVFFGKLPELHGSDVPALLDAEMVQVFEEAAA